MTTENDLACVLPDGHDGKHELAHRPRAALPCLYRFENEHWIGRMVILPPDPMEVMVRESAALHGRAFVYRDPATGEERVLDPKDVTIVKPLPTDPPPDVRREALIEAYWKLRDHASALRDTQVYRKAAERSEHEHGGRDHERYRWLEATARGIEDGAHDLAEMLGVPEYEIERPAPERTS